MPNKAGKVAAANACGRISAKVAFWRVACKPRFNCGKITCDVSHPSHDYTGRIATHIIFPTLQQK
jgi:hypothetical protein